MNQEIELKLSVPKQALWRLRRHPGLASVTQRKLAPQQLVSIYYDTPDLELRDRGVALRLRRVGKRWIQTIKTNGQASAGLHSRSEWESETAENTLDFAAIGDPELKQFLADSKRQQALRAAFVTQFKRSSRILRCVDGTEVECSLDQGEIVAGDRRLPICELELELKSGGAVALFDLAQSLVESLPLRLENQSKAERGYQLANAEESKPVKAKVPGLNKDMTASVAFESIVQSCLAHLQANEAGVLNEEDSEYVHQMRVALRRMRSAIGLFCALVPKEKSLAVREELRWLTKELDGARNWDVFCLTTLPPMAAAFPADEGLAWLSARTAQTRIKQNVRAREAAASKRYQRLLLNLGSWLLSAPWTGSETAESRAPIDPPARELAVALLQKQHKRLRKRGDDLISLSPEARHQVRIAAKKLRYAAEFFSALFGNKRVRAYVDALADLQTVLGAVNDAATTVALLSELQSPELQAHQRLALDIVKSWVLGASQAQMRELGSTWERFRKQKKFW